MCLARILRWYIFKDFKVENNSLVSVAAGTGEMNYDRIIRFMKERKPYIHATLENTVPENAVASREYIQRLWEECHVGIDFLISTTWFGVPLIKSERYFY